MEDLNVNEKDHYFIYFIGESTASIELIDEAKEFFPNIELKNISLIILHTLVTFETALHLKSILKNEKIPFKNIKSILIPSTEYNITKYIVRTYDKPNTIIKILGGSWINAAAINSEIKYSKLYVLKSKFKKMSFQQIPEKWDLKCRTCNQSISYFKINQFMDNFPKKELWSPICTNKNCYYYNNETIAYTANENVTQEDFYLKSNLIEIGDYQEIELETQFDNSEITENTKETNIDEFNLESQEVPDSWNLYCFHCNHVIKKRYVEKSENINSYFICSNPNCIKFISNTIAYTSAPSGMRCWKCLNDITRYQVSFHEMEKRLEYRPYCDKCSEIRERNIKIKSFEELEK